MCSEEENERSVDNIKSWRQKGVQLSNQARQERRGEHVLYVNKAVVPSASNDMSKRDCFIAKTSLKIR
jgi:hypothetical protein